MSYSYYIYKYAHKERCRLKKKKQLSTLTTVFYQFQPTMTTLKKKKGQKKESFLHYVANQFSSFSFQSSKNQLMKRYTKYFSYGTCTQPSHLNNLINPQAPVAGSQFEQERQHSFCTTALLVAAMCLSYPKCYYQ